MSTVRVLCFAVVVVDDDGGGLVYGRWYTVVGDINYPYDVPAREREKNLIIYLKPHVPSLAPCYIYAGGPRIVAYHSPQATAEIVHYLELVNPKTDGRLSYR